MATAPPPAAPGDIPPHRAYKNMHGQLTCENQVEHTTPDGILRVLVLRTSRRSSGFLVSDVSTHTLEGQFMTHVMMRDFSRAVLQARLPRVGARNVEEQHAAMLAQMEDIKKAVDLHYPKKEPA